MKIYKNTIILIIKNKQIIIKKIKNPNLNMNYSKKKNMK